MSSTRQLPVIALRDAVLFPGITTPVGAVRKPTRLAIEASVVSHDRWVFAVLQKDNDDEIQVENLHNVGTLARISQLQRGSGGVQLILQGEQRAVVARFDSSDGYLLATVHEPTEEQPIDAENPAFVALFRETRERAAELGAKAGLPAAVIEQFLADITEPGRFADLVAGTIEATTEERQALLETLSVEDRLRRVLILTQKQLAIHSAQEDIKSKVQEEIGDRQREIYLREQLKAIQHELGDDDQPGDLEELQSKIKDLDLPKVVRKEVNRELKRLQRISGESMEAQVIRTYLETIAELPWNTRSAEHIDLEHASLILDEDHYAMGDVKDRVLEFLAIRLLRGRKKPSPDAATVALDGGESKGDASAAPLRSASNRVDQSGRAPILLFVGPPGVGKTSVAKSIARAMGREYVRVSLGGARDEADIRGHRRTYVGAMPGRIIQGMKQAGTKNPVFLLDEVDKLGVSFQGDPASALLEVLDPAQNDTFVDHYMGVPFDLSEVMFIVTANFIQSIPGPLLDRMEVVNFAGYTEQEKLEIAKRYLLPRQLGEGGLDGEQLVITNDAISTVIAGYTRESGVRQLEREIGKLARKIARRIAGGKHQQFIVDGELVPELLGRPKVHPEHASTRDQIGIATGMYYTPVGGDIMFVEVSTMRGKGDLVLTGQLGDVMKESARAAFSYARAHADLLQIDPEAFSRDVHIHVPAGAIPKDGPSAGVTMATALVSALSGQPVRHDLAMTGEITLSGRVLPIGGVKEKVLGALRAGITTILLPKDNLADLEDLPKEARDALKIVSANTLDEVLTHALPGATFREGRLFFTPEGIATMESTGDTSH